MSSLLLLTFVDQPSKSETPADLIREVSESPSLLDILPVLSFHAIHESLRDGKPVREISVTYRSTPGVVRRRIVTTDSAIGFGRRYTIYEDQFDESLGLHRYAVTESSTPEFNLFEPVSSPCDVLKPIDFVEERIHHRAFGSQLNGLLGLGIPCLKGMNGPPISLATACREASSVAFLQPESDDAFAIELTIDQRSPLFSPDSNVERERIELHFESRSSPTPYKAIVETHVRGQVAPVTTKFEITEVQPIGDRLSFPKTTQQSILRDGNWETINRVVVPKCSTELSDSFSAPGRFEFNWPENAVVYSIDGVLSETPPENAKFHIIGARSEIVASLENRTELRQWCERRRPDASHEDFALEVKSHPASAERSLPKPFILFAVGLAAIAITSFTVFGFKQLGNRNNIGE